jgi:uncharacterized protein YbjT (DUF2867 family)
MAGQVLVTGATGNTGRPLVELLRTRGVPVRAMVRSAAPAPRFGDGVEEFVADFDDSPSIAAALAGVERAYLVTPSSERAQAQQERFVDLAAEAGVRHVVKLSQFAATADSPVRFLRYHAAVEQRLRDSGIDYTMLQPNLYFQGLLAMAGTIREHGQLMAPIGDARVSAVDVRDIAAVAAVALTEPGHTGASYPITGPVAVTHAEIAAALSTATGRPITFLDVPAADFGAALRGALPAWQVDGLMEDYAHYARGEAAAVSPTVPELTGRPARGIDEFAREYAGAFG